MPKIEVHDAPDSLVRRWEECQSRDVHFVTGPYLRSLETIARAADALMACLDEFGHEGYCGERYEALGTALAAITIRRGGEGA